MAKEFLPIGSVVKLVDSSALAMIAGYLPITPVRADYVWDYLGFKFPIGYTDDDKIYCFDHTQIEVVYAYGYRDIEQDIFAGHLPEMQEDVLTKFRSGQVQETVGAETDKEEN